MNADQNAEMLIIMYSIMKSLNRIANVLDKEINCAGCGEPYEGEGDCPDCRCSDTCGCTDEERGIK